jgi:hypothetical protein
MSNAFVEPRPKSRDEHTAIAVYVVDTGTSIMGGPFATQVAAIAWAKNLGHKPLVARVRHLTDRNKPDHWREA